MLNFSRLKAGAVLCVCLIGIMLGIPSLIPTGHLPAWYPQSHVNLGLDLNGGSYLLLEGDTADLAKTRIEAMRDSVSGAMHNGTPRIEIGDISTRGGQLTFAVSKPSQIALARQRLSTITGSAVGITGQSQWDVNVLGTNRFSLKPTEAGLTQAIDTAMKDATEVVRRRIDELGTKEPTIVRQGATRIVVQVPGLEDPQALKKLVGTTAKLEFKLVDQTANPADLAKGIAPVGSQVLPYPDNPQGVPFVALKRPVVISGEQVADARQEFDPQTNAPNIAITFDAEGGRRFAKVTSENVNKPFAIILDNKVISVANINEPILGGRASIAGNYTVQTANDLAIALRSGKLAVNLKIVAESTVSPDLGHDSVRAGVIASVVAAVAVILFMLATYGRFGLYANIAVVINVFVILAVMAFLKATLTLPGIAGFVLTIGTAVDANVLINERIREERRRGRSVIQSVELGYKEASRTIFEANVTHAITGVIMLLLGSGPVKGFAVVLLIGICSSVFTAVTFTRMMVALWLRKNRPTTINI
ncbi:protein translocase subunit SecD [Sphingomonas sp. PP-CE-1G-424]|uniref:protein translocase subunit SecD n=1 Tax=Sphingomonas sp. PP-CE-1G-424 TaxID=2135658 RepID=UPI001056C344|nr:protein translocase subunit SecD [Sphingomonas sp. PP-CE-1G-424]TCP71535.1 preprotein translocase subunit SecD [Sphingomonas sp. PP-CE-1G-424]